MARTEEIIPEADEFVPFMEHEGYEPKAAIADLIDNSISAGANEITVNFNWNHGSDANIQIIDNGAGMDESSLVRSMRLASNSKRIRDATDLGRFGMGLKTGGFSLGKRITLISKRDNVTSSVSWDLSKYDDSDYISDSKTKGWVIDVDVTDFENYEEYAALLNSQESGTILILDKLRLVKNDKHLEKKHNEFFNDIEDIKTHLSLIYHKLLSKEKSESAICISVNNEILEPWDPFFRPDLRQDLGEFVLGNVTIHPYVMPRPSKLTDADKKLLTRAPIKNERGAMMQLQGFYLYRNKRLIEYGNWYGLCRKNEGYSLARISIEISSDLDDEWNIDVKKSKARPPAEIKDPYLKNAMMRATQTSLKTLNSHESYQRNRNLPPPGGLWREGETHTHKAAFFINRKHPFYRKMKETMTEIQKEALDTYLTALENTFPPIKSIQSLEDESNAVEHVEKLAIEEDLDKMRKLISAFRKSGYDDDGIKKEISYWQCFNYLRNYVDGLLNEVKK